MEILCAVPVMVTNQADHPCGLEQHLLFTESLGAVGASVQTVDTDPADSVQSHRLKCHHQGFGSARSSSLCPQECWKPVFVRERGDVSPPSPLSHPGDMKAACCRRLRLNFNISRAWVSGKKTLRTSLPGKTHLH